MKNRFNVLMAAAGSVLACASVGRSALAYAHNTSAIDERLFGNGNFFASSQWIATEEAWGRHAEHAQTARQGHSTYAEVFDKGFYMSEVEADSWAFYDVPLGYTTRAIGRAAFLGNDVYNVSTTQPCAGKAGTSCVSFNRTLSKTLFSASAEFALGYVPVTVNASVTGTVTAGLSARSTANKYLGIQNSLFGNANSILNAGASATARMQAFAGIEDVLGVGVNLNFRLIDVAVTPSVSNHTAVPFRTGIARVSYNTQLPLRITTMSGRVDVYADVTPFITFEKNLINWSGYSRTYTPYQNSGYQDLPI